ncbi:hypothetical protein [Stackebrandtia nassauensis]|uniref:Uncharacterized protein n=1 Tax=Stackebrandtia nassauensis (strain DSM 44728 / CIP 108903 / NRRL B-16338 / NBRC 102104 / LLR-40K-21) TaxID=446470 RepID=D3PUN8_STANL|nr:hypothetical protein [Stackebrandtia nassauensis]ADD43051.1 hypothetical protein Snas_3387 [Stackebrandtia nassauensis DSM 44728]
MRKGNREFKNREFKVKPVDVVLGDLMKEVPAASAPKGTCAGFYCLPPS